MTITLTQKRIIVLMIFGFLIALFAFPIPIGLWYFAFVPAEHHVNAGKIIIQNMKNWWIIKNYLPWNSWLIVFVKKKGILIWLTLTIIWVALFGYMGRNKKKSNSEWGGPPAAGNGQYGTAHLRSTSGKGGMQESFVLWDAEKTNNPSGVMIGQAGPGKAWVLDRDEHVLLIGTTRSRKTRSLILPTIGVIGSSAKESMVISDIKGELYAMTAEWLRNQGYEIIRFDLRDPARGSRWNPIQAVVDAFAAGEVDKAATIARDIAHVITYSSEYRGTDPIWPQSQEALITALVLAVADGTPPPGGMKIEGEPWVWPKDEEKHMGTVYSALLAGGPGGHYLDAWINQFPPTHPAYEAYGPVRLSQERARAGILTGASAQLGLWADTKTKWLTAVQDHEIDGVGKKPTAVFLIIPDEVSTKYPLATLYIQQTVKSLLELADKNKGRLPVRVNFILDEFGNLPQIGNFESNITASLSRGIRFCMAVQDLEQIKKHYPDGYSTIRGNCGTWVYLLTGSNDTAKEISIRCGEYTTYGESKSMPKIYWTSSSAPGHATDTSSLMARSLFKPDELLRWPELTSLVMQNRYAPAKLPMPDISSWAKEFPHIQKPVSFPEPVKMESVPVWRLPVEPENTTGNRDNLDISRKSRTINKRNLKFNNF